MKKYILISLMQLSLLFSSPGDLLWRYQTNGNIETSPLVYNNTVYFGGGKNYYALNASNGQKNWAIQIGTKTYGRPCIQNSKLYVSGIDSPYTIFCLNPESGNLFWSYETAGANYSSPVVEDGILYSGSLDRYLYAINASTGSLKWKYYANGEVHSACTYNAMGLVYFGTTNANLNLFALDMASSQLSWSFNTTNYVYDPTFANGNIYCCSVTSGVYAVNAVNGEQIWMKHFGYPKYLFNKPVISNNMVFFGCNDNSFYALDEKTGSIKWSYATGEDIRSNAFVQSSVVYFGSMDKCVYALDIDNGNLKWRYNVQSVISDSDPFVSGGIVFIGCSDTYLYAIETYGYAGFSNYETNRKSIPEQFDAAPNPCRDYLILSLPKDTQIYSLSGQLIRKLAPGKYRIETKNWITGIYIIKSGEETRKIIKYN